MMTEQRRQELIADCEREMAHLERCCERYDTIGPNKLLESCQSELERQQIALASLNSEVADRIINERDARRVDGIKVSDCVNLFWPVGTAFYTAPPVPVIKLPEKENPIIFQVFYDECDGFCYCSPDIGKILKVIKSEIKRLNDLGE